MRLLYTDTDSLVLHFFTDDLFDDMGEFLEKYDASNYDQSHPLYSEKNKKVVGLFKDELGGKLITEFVGLRSKMYSYSGEESGKRAKEVKTSVLKKTVTLDDFRNCLLDQSVFHREMTTLRSHRHGIFGETVNKIALSPLDTKDSSQKMDVIR